MKVRMLSSAPGSIDGIHVVMYEVDQEYDLTTTAGSRDLAAAFVDAGLAEELGAKGVASVEVARADVDCEAPASAKPGRKPKAQ
jgi:hypothetical protein